MNFYVTKSFALLTIVPEIFMQHIETKVESMMHFVVVRLCGKNFITLKHETHDFGHFSFTPFHPSTTKQQQKGSFSPLLSTLSSGALGRKAHKKKRLRRR